MLNKTNIILLLLVLIGSIYVIVLNGDIYNLYKKHNKLLTKYTLLTQKNQLMELEIISKTSNLFIEEYATENLNMRYPPKTHTFQSSD